jgi:nucleoside-diphosphate-sugar epimerase
VEDVVTTAMANALTLDLDHVLEQMGGRLWSELRGARIFVTGGTGFFGCWLLETLLWANDRLRLGASVVVLTRNPPAFATKAPHLASAPAVTLHAGDVRDFAFPDGAFSHAIHAGMDASTGLDTREPRAMFDMMVGGTARVLELARRTGVTRLLLTSSGSVYGRQPADVERLAEDYTGAPDPSDARMMHGEGKRAAEMLCALYADARLHPTIARCFAFVGPYLPIDTHFAVGNFIRDALSGGPIRVSGDGTPCRSYLYAADLAIWLWTILVRGEEMRPYNVGSGTPVTIAELANEVAHVVEPPLTVEIARQPQSNTQAHRYVPAVTRAERELGLRVTISLTDAIRRTVEWHRKRLVSA